MLTANLEREMEMTRIPKKLLIFDLNKVLLCKNKHKHTSFFLRPFVHDFILDMFQLFDVAVWTSGRTDTMNKAMNHIFGHCKDKLVFYWTQNECTQMNLRYPYEFKKELSKVWEQFPQYNQHNTVSITPLFFSFTHPLIHSLFLLFD